MNQSGLDKKLSNMMIENSERQFGSLMMEIIRLKSANSVLSDQLGVAMAEIETLKVKKNDGVEGDL